jgi:hypothetical protein
LLLIGMTQKKLKELIFSKTSLNYLLKVKF